MQVVKSVAALLDQITQDIAYSNAHARLVDTARVAEKAVEENLARRAMLEQRGLMPWNDGWELRCQAHAALLRAYPHLCEGAQTARRAVTRHTRNTACITRDSASIARERQLVERRTGMYLSGD